MCAICHKPVNGFLQQTTSITITFKLRVVTSRFTSCHENQSFKKNAVTEMAGDRTNHNKRAKKSISIQGRVPTTSGSVGDGGVRPGLGGLGLVFVG
jgi:hypothetical protein